MHVEQQVYQGRDLQPIPRFCCIGMLNPDYVEMMVEATMEIVLARVTPFVGIGIPMRFLHIWLVSSWFASMTYIDNQWMISVFDCINVDLYFHSVLSYAT